MVAQDKIQAFFAADGAAGRSAAVHAILQPNPTPVSFLHLVKALGEHLTGTDNVMRCKATDLLAQVLRQSPGILAAKDVAHIGGFFAARLKDWPCLEPALEGCEEILQLGVRTSVSCPESTALEVMEAFGKYVNPQSLTQPVRYRALQLWLAALKGYGVPAARAGIDLVNITVVAVDGEKDPRCLLLLFQCVQAVSSVYQQPNVPGKHMKDNVENLFEVVSCYFPISFTPPQNDAHAITREDLVAGLHETMCCSPLFVQYCIPLLLEKLNSSVRSAQQDSLSLLVECCSSFGHEGMLDHLSAVWMAMKQHLTATITAADGGEIGKDQLQGQQHLAEKVAQTLTACIGNLGNDALTRIALSDSTVEDLTRHVIAVASNNSQRAAANAPVGVAATIIGAVAAASPHACALVSESLLPQLLAALTPAASSESLALGLSALHLILHRINEATSSRIWQSPGADAFGKVHAGLRAVVVKPWSKLVPAEEGGADAMDMDSGSTDDEVELLQVLLWHDLLKVPPQFNILQPDDMKKISHFLSEVLLVSGADIAEVATPVLWGQPSPNPRAEALRALKTLLEGTSAHLVVDEVLPRLIPAVISGEGLPQDPQAAGGIIKLLTTMAVWSPEVATQLLQTLIPTLLQQLEKSLTANVQEIGTLVLSQLAEDVAPTLPVPLGADVAPGVTRLMKQILALGSATMTRSGLTAWSAELTAAAVKATTRLLALCSAEEQSGMARDICDLIERCHASPGPTSILDQHEGLAISLGSAAVVALRSGVLPDGSCLSIAQALTDIITTEKVASTPYEDSRGIAAVALASVVNKWAPASEQDLQRCLDSTINRLTASSSSGRAAVIRKNAYRGLSWVARGLALRGHPGCQTILSQVLGYLEHPTQEPIEDTEEEKVVMWQAAQIFYTCTSDSASCSDVSLGRPQHVLAKGLWRQRTFTYCRNSLLSHIRAATRATPVADVDMVGESAGTSTSAKGLYFGFACLVQGTSLQHVCMELSDVLPVLLDSMMHVQKELGSLAKDALLGCLLVLSHVFLDKQLREQVDGHVEALLQVLTSLARLPGAWAVREGSYDCLVAAMELPYHSLHPLRQKVLKVAVQGLDDDKRAVREAAVRCRAVWGP